MKFPLFIYIKPPDDSILQKIVPVVWWDSQYITDEVSDEQRKQAYHASCDTLKSHVQALEDLQVCKGQTSPQLDLITVRRGGGGAEPPTDMCFRSMCVL